MREAVLFCVGSGLALSASLCSAALPKGEPLAVHANFIFLPRPLPLGVVSPQVTERARMLTDVRLFPQESSAENAGCLYEPRHEKAKRRLFQIVLFCRKTPAKMAGNAIFQRRCVDKIEILKKRKIF